MDKLAQEANDPAGVRSLVSGQTLDNADAIQLNDLLSQPVLSDGSGRVLVRITLNGETTVDALSRVLTGMGGIELSGVDASYRAGVIEAYVPAGKLAGVADLRGVLAVVPSSPFVTNTGIVATQGVVQHRVDQISGVDGSGITIGVLSDSYDVSSSPIRAADDIATGDLPGAGNPLGNTEPIVILQDPPNGSDEGRAMLQIIHDLAPKARLGFATALGGEVNFANNIRALAGFPDAENVAEDFAADVIVDDIIYLAEPFFQDGIVAQAVDEVAEAGVAYFSSAGNRPASQAYDAMVNIVPADPSSWANTNLNMGAVPPEIYAGGFHDFDESEGIDIAQTISINPRGTIVFQWNEPFDPVPPQPVALIAEGTGTVPVGGFDFFTFEGKAGQFVEVFVDADDSTTGVPNPDLMLTLLDPSFGVLQFQDTGTNPESIIIELPVDGTYYGVVEGFQGVGGDYLYTVQEVELVERVVSDYNLLFFLTNGTFLGAVAENNRFTNRPIELAGINGTVTIQLVIARANDLPTNNKLKAADRLRYVWFTSGQPQEYFSYLGPVTYGHNSAEGAIGVAAYAFYPPYIPEGFSSPGPVTIYFNGQNKRMLQPKIREKPDLAAMDGANTTFFGTDVTEDPDPYPNFFGTSAAAPHAAAIGALVLDAAGGPGSLKPAKLLRILKASTFPHDLDPFYASGSAAVGGNVVHVSATADPNSISQFDPQVFLVQNNGTMPLASVSINGSDGNPTQVVPGVVFDERVGPGQPFVIGALSGLNAGDINQGFSLPADPPALAGQWKQLDLAFAPASFGDGDFILFGVDRDEADNFTPVPVAGGGNSADLLGGGVLIPAGTVLNSGASFFGMLEDGSAFSGSFQNTIGRGYSPLDGYGFINAEAAVKSVQKSNQGKKP